MDQECSRTPDTSGPNTVPTSAAPNGIPNTVYKISQEQSEIFERCRIPHTPDPHDPLALPQPHQPPSGPHTSESASRSHVAGQLQAADSNALPPSHPPTTHLPSPPHPRRHVIAGFLYPLTCTRQDSEQRDRLTPHRPNDQEKRLASRTRRRAVSDAGDWTSDRKVLRHQKSAPDVAGMAPLTHAQTNPTVREFDMLGIGGKFLSTEPEELKPNYSASPSVPLLPPPPLFQTAAVRLDEMRLASEEGSVADSDDDEDPPQSEVDSKWILNLSMTFKDGSDREKFFMTYAEKPNLWRKVTVSCDYRDVAPDTLEAELSSLPWQRDKSAAIYRAIKRSLPEINFFPTVTNLKLQTADGRLHVHVTEDCNEIIPYPEVGALTHLLELEENPLRTFRESEVQFQSHLSGFVYQVDGAWSPKAIIKKEIPGPDMVDEFLYEINALHALTNERDVIDFVGIVVDERQQLVKGLLIAHAERGALVDILFDHREYAQAIPWQRREKWARQIVRGLSAIHEAGFVQGDFTLSNIVVDDEDDAKIIDINRRGCPVGWEPPEFLGLIRDGQRVGMYIGIKSDIYQLGKVLYGIAESNDEPERRPTLPVEKLPADVPDYFRQIIADCLSTNPRGRPMAQSLLARFPPDFEERAEVPTIVAEHVRDASVDSRLAEKEYIDPKMAVTRSDIEEHRQRQLKMPRPVPSGDWTDLVLSESNSNLETSPESRYNVASSKTSAAPPSGISPIDDECFEQRFEALSSDAAKFLEPRSRLMDRVAGDPSRNYIKRSLGRGAAAAVGGRGTEGGEFGGERAEDLESRPETLRWEPLVNREQQQQPPQHNESASTPKQSQVIASAREDELATPTDLRRPVHQDSGFDEHLDDEYFARLTASSGSNLVGSSTGIGSSINSELQGIGAQMGHVESTRGFRRTGRSSRGWG